MVLLALAGGFGSLGGLGQALGGPSLPSGARSASSVTTPGGNGTAVAALLPVVARSAAPTLVASVALPKGPTRGGGRTGGHPRSPGGSNGSGSTADHPDPTPGSTTAHVTDAGSGRPARDYASAASADADQRGRVTRHLDHQPDSRPDRPARDERATERRPHRRQDPSSRRASAVSRLTGTVSSTVSQVQNGVGQLGSRVSGLLHALQVP